MGNKIIATLIVLFLIVACISATVTVASIGTVTTIGRVAESVDDARGATATAASGVAQVVIPYQTGQPPLRADIKKLNSMMFDGGILELKAYHGVYNVQAGDSPTEGFDPKSWLIGDFAKLHIETDSIAKTDLTVAHVYVIESTIVVELVEPYVETTMDSARSFTEKSISGVLNQTPVDQVELVNAVVAHAQKEGINQGLIVQAKDFAVTFFTPFFDEIDDRPVHVIWTSRPEITTCLFPGYSSAGNVGLADWLLSTPRYVSWRTAIELNPGIEQLYAQDPNVARQINVPADTNCGN